jgi:hypothetical protein
VCVCVRVIRSLFLNVGGNNSAELKEKKREVRR